MKVKQDFMNRSFMKTWFKISIAVELLYGYNYSKKYYQNASAQLKKLIDILQEPHTNKLKDVFTVNILKW